MAPAAPAAVASPVEIRSSESHAPPIVMDGRSVTSIAREHRFRVSAGPIAVGWEWWRPARIVVDGANGPGRAVAIPDWEARVVLGIWIAAVALVATRRTRRSR